MEWSQVFMIIVLVAVGMVVALIAYGIAEARKRDDHKRKLELLREERIRGYRDGEL